MKSEWKDELRDYSYDEIVESVEKYSDSELDRWSGKGWVITFKRPVQGNRRYMICAKRNNPNIDPIMVTPVMEATSGGYTHVSGGKLLETSGPEPYDSVLNKAVGKAIDDTNE